jgi:uncharacterized protein
VLIDGAISGSLASISCQDLLSGPICGGVFEAFTTQSPHTVFLLAAIACVAGLARGFSGFGAALIFVPLAAKLLGPQMAAALLLLTDAALTAPLVAANWSKAQRPEVALMSLGAALGIPLGTLVLRWSDPLVLRWGIAVLVALMLGLLVSGWRYWGKPWTSATVAVGVVSGLFSGIAQIGGPPVVAYWLGGDHSPEKMRASTILFFATATVIAIASYLVGGLLTIEVFTLSLLLVPFFGCGLLVGSKSFRLARADVFRRLCFALIAVSLLVSLPVWG